MNNDERITAFRELVESVKENAKYFSEDFDSDVELKKGRKEKYQEIDLRKAFDIYYSSKFAEQISSDSYVIENMDAKYLAEDLIQNESELLKKE